MLVVHENAALLKGSQFKVLGSLRVEFKQFLEGVGVQIHGSGLVYRIVHLLLADICGSEGAEDDVAFEAKQELVVIEDGQLWHLHKLSAVTQQQVNCALLNQHNFVGLTPVRLDFDLWQVDTRIQLNDELILEALLARVEKVLKLLHELAKYVLNQLSLHLGRQSLVQAVLLHNQVEIKVESISHRVLDLLAKLWMQEVWLV